MKRILLIDIQSFFWSYLKIRHQLRKYDAISLVYSNDHFSKFNSLGFFLKGLINIESSCRVDFYAISGREDGISLNVKLVQLANELADSFNPMNDIFHIMCHQFPNHPIQKTLEDNGFFFSTLESSPIFLDFDDEKEVEEFLKNCQRKNSQLLPISDAKPYDPNEIIKKEKDHENDHLIDVELLNLSVIDFIREDFKWFKRGNWN